MAFGGYDPDKQGPMTCGAVSDDGLAWKELETGDARVRGRLIRPGCGAWEDTHETPCWLRRKDGSWILWYIGYVDRGGWVKSAPAAIGCATAADGLAFKPVSDKPVLSPASGGLDGFSITAPCVVSVDQGYFMVYVGWGFPEPTVFRAQLLAARSPDGIHWTKVPRSIFAGSDLPEYGRAHQAEPDLIRTQDGSWLLFFTAPQGRDGHVIGLARAASLEGPWTFSPEPVIQPTRGMFDERMTVAPCALIENQRLRVWYAGFDASGKHIAIGHAECAWPLR